MKKKTENTAPKTRREVREYTVTFRDGKTRHETATSAVAAARRSRLEREVVGDPCDVAHVNPPDTDSHVNYNK